MTTATTPTAFIDPRTAYPQPPFKEQKAIDFPGLASDMNPRADHGEDSYQGHNQLDGMVAIITGADSGIGRATAIAYAREGARLVLNDLPDHPDGPATHDYLKEQGADVTWAPGDLQDKSFCADLIEKTVSTYGDIGILVNNAAYQDFQSDLDDWDETVFENIFKTNVFATFRLCKAAVKHMPAGASIINTVSIQSYVPTGALLGYAASKAALASMTNSLAQLCIDDGIRVNAVAPGPVWTPFVASTMPPEKIEKFGGSTVLGRPAQPAEMAPLFVWLASKQSTYVTGEVFGATGGKMPL